jgi:multidrug efflux pump subunit AcrB
MEMQITIPIEKIMNTVPGVVSSRSRTIFGLSIVSLIFEEKKGRYDFNVDDISKKNKGKLAILLRKPEIKN